MTMAAPSIAKSKMTNWLPQIKAPNLRAHLPILDGLRGIAILLVLVFHTTRIKATAPIDDYYFMFGRSGWIGVDLFFVLSGFLITGILFDTKGEAGFFKTFYMRRTLRIFPLYYLVIAFCIFVAPHIDFFSHPTVPDPRPRQWWYWLYMSNYLAAREGLRHLLLGPTWSLAIEEQFYLVWPLLVCLLSRRTMMTVCVVLVTASCAVRLYLLSKGTHPTTIYVMTHTRLDPIAIGAFVALLLRGERAKTLDKLRLVFPYASAVFVPSACTVAYFLCKGYLNKNLPVMITYGYTSVALFFGSGLLLLIGTQPQFFLHRIISNPIFRFFGKYSYALYLFNRPLVALVPMYLFSYRDVPRLLGSSIPGQIAFTLCIIAIATGMALLSWHLFEKHFLRLKRFFPHSKTEPPTLLKTNSAELNPAAQALR